METRHFENVFEAAFYDRMNQTPVEFIFQKMKAGTDWGAARYEYGIIAHEIERKIDCKAVCFEHYCPKREASVEHPTQYNRLIRDREPAILEKSGKHCIVERLDDKAYLEALDNELQAVLNKYRRKHSLEELADLLELMGCAVKACGFTWEKLRCERMKKQTKCGGFDKRLFLKDVVEEKI